MLLAGVFQFVNRKEYYTEDYKNFFINKKKQLPMKWKT